MSSILNYTLTKETEIYSILMLFILIEIVINLSFSDPLNISFHNQLTKKSYKSAIELWYAFFYVLRDGETIALAALASSDQTSAIVSYLRIQWS